jgi:hypothetical protein
MQYYLFSNPILSPICILRHFAFSLEILFNKMDFLSLAASVVYNIAILLFSDENDDT